MRLWLFAMSIGVLAAQVPAPPAYKFSPGDAALNIPIELVANGLVFVRAEVNDHPGWFIVDNATQEFTVDQDFAHQNGLQAGGSANAQGGGANSIRAAVARDARIRLGSLDLTHRNLVVIPLKTLESTMGHALDGTLGSRLFDDFVVAINYGERRLSVYGPKQYHPSGRERALPVATDEHGFQFIDARVDLHGIEPIHGRFLIDGGANTYADIYKPFADAHGIPPPSWKLLNEPGASTGGTTESREGRADRISIGPYSVQNPPIMFAQDSEGLMASKEYPGLIGAEFLERLTVVFDNPGKRLFLTPNQRYRDIPEYDQSGLRLRAEGADFRTFFVTRILPRSPAAEAEIQPGDILESIDNRPAGQFTLTEIRSMLCRPIASYAIDIQRGSSHIRVTLKLRPQL